LQWQDGNLGASSFRISRSVNNGSFSTLKTVSGIGFTVNATDDNDIRRGNNYRYQVVAVEGNQTSPPSNIASVTVGNTILNPPAGLSGNYIPSQNLVRLTWSDDNSNETGFTIERAVNNDTFTPLTTISQTGSNISYDDTGVTNQNTYKYRVRTNAGSQSSSYSNIITVELDQDLVAPLNLTGTYDPANNRIVLNWDDINSDETFFEVERMVGFGNFDQIGTVTGNGSSFSYNDNGVSPNGSFRYRVRAVRPDDASPYSNTAIVSTVNILNAPTNLTGVYQPANNRIRLTWQDSNPDETGFQVERSVNNGAYGVLSNLNTTGSNLAYNDTQIVAGNTYRYRVRAKKNSSLSPYSNIATVVIAAGVTAPSNLSATVLSSNGIRINWQDNSNNETEFRVERATGNNGQYSRVATLSANSTQFTSAGLLPNTIYRFRVSAANSSSVSSYSNAVSVRTFNSVPNAPSNHQSTFNATTVAVDFTWSDNSNNDTGHEIDFRLQGTSAWTRLQLTIPGNATSASTPVSNVQGGQTYETRVRATNAVGASAWSNIASVYLPPNPTPVAPSNLTATYLSASNEVRLNWWDNSNNETKFIIEFIVLNSQWSQLIHEPAANTNTITFAAPPCCFNYTFRIKAVNNNGSSLWSNTASAFVSGSTASRSAENTKANAYPNPFKDEVKIKYSSKTYAGDVQIIDPV
ncbi:MAG: fibronectin type III domain-containing protein, partial [Cyclobacteriaceae bacterium]